MNHQPIPYYQLSPEETLRVLKSTKNGLDDREIETRKKFYGANKLLVESKESMIWKLVRQFKDLMVIILLVSGSLSLYFADYRSAIIMYTIVVINAFIGFFQEYKAEKVMDALKVLIQAKAKVIRGGKELEIGQDEIVPGDIVVLEEGDSVPADVRLLDENTLATNDFILTGESNPSRKFLHAIEGDVVMAERHNLAYMGTTVATGNAHGIVIATGMHTEIGRIAHLTQQTGTELSPLQRELNNLAKRLTVITLVIAAILFVIALVVHFTWEQAFIFAVGVASAMVPEGLPSQVSIALSLAANRLAKQKAVIKKLSAVETLGATHIICTDKTGTLTKNEMTVQKVIIGRETLGTTCSGYEPKGNVVAEDGTSITTEKLNSLRLFFENGVFASNAQICAPDHEHTVWYCLGDPTEAALIVLAHKAGIDPDHLNQTYPELKEFTFDSVRKRMSSFRNRDGVITLYVKGAPQSVLDRCTQIWDGEKIRLLTEDDRKWLVEKDNQLASAALRNLGYAYRVLPSFDPECTMDQVEQELVWLGMVAMIDPPREEVAEAMAAAAKAHIRVIIITGDYALTAEAIAKRVGLNPDSAQATVINGQDLKGMSDIDLLHKMLATNLIFARTSPEDKLRIVNILKQADQVVAVTGDGVNDAPALKKADIGVAMGKTGTEVAKNSAEIVLLDDSFGTLVSAIKEGRVIFQNLKKTIVANMCGNSTELFTILLSLIGASIWGLPLAILAYQVLAVDLVGQMLPITFLTWDTPELDVMQNQPRNPQKHIMTKASLLDFAQQGLIMGGIAYANFLLFFYRNGHALSNIATDSSFYLQATTLTYVTIVVIQWLNILSRRVSNQSSVWTSYIWSNKRLLLGYAISLFLVLNVVYNPVISQVLATAALTLWDWVYIVGAGILSLFIREYTKRYFAKDEVKEECEKSMMMKNQKAS